MCRNSLVMQTDCCISCLGGWSQTIFEVKRLDVEVLGWCGYMWSAVVRPVGCTAKFSESPLETADGREMNMQYMGNSSGGHSVSNKCVRDALVCVYDVLGPANIQQLRTAMEKEWTNITQATINNLFSPFFRHSKTAHFIRQICEQYLREIGPLCT